jgi:hypothetical protein
MYAAGSLGPGAPLDQRGHSRRERHRLAAACAGDDRSVPDREYGGLLLRIQVLEHVFEA